MSFNIRRDFVVGLLTGRYQDDVLPNGSKISKFVPNKLNRYPVLSDLIASNPDKTVDYIYSVERLRHKPLNLRRNESGNIAEFVKSDKEKSELKKLKKAHEESLRKAGFNPRIRLNISEPFTLLV